MGDKLMLNQQQLANFQDDTDSVDPVGYYTALRPYGVGYSVLYAQTAPSGF